MGMGIPMNHLLCNAKALRQTWQVWFEGPHNGRKEALEENLEYFLKEAEWGLNAVKEEWRTAFKNAPKNPRLDEYLHREVVRPQAEAIEQKWAGKD
jgi:hypothetical protein